ncbi:NADP-dependent oxidoreductase [Pseudochrobactrum sp. MP213Fo]|uniref:NADP-dependent oxidoreductase n=1 Tax=Pseudochrobactrum sp. MP213Fo TaxID=3022250 RepID=UPI003BA3A309
MTEISTKRIVLASRPIGKPVPENFRIETAAVGQPADGQVLLKLRYLSLDPYMRGRMSDAKSYAAPLAVGDPIEGGTVGEVIASRHQGFAVGDMVLSYSGWQTYALAEGAALRKLDPDAAPVTTALGVLGMPGFAAYSGLLTIGKPKAGETVVVAAASGPVGSAVGQIAHIKNARAVGIAGGADKCRALTDDFGFDVALDHHRADFAEALKDACPSGIDVYFENVGGKVFDAVLPLLNEFARIPVCGLIAQYNSTGLFEGPDRLPRLMGAILSRSLTIRGFIQREFSDQRPVFYEQMAQWVKNGQVRYREDIVDGIENAPQAFIGLLEGKNFGKLIIRID